MLKFLTKITKQFCTTETIETATKKISKFELKNFSDHVKIVVAGGHGGNGSISYFTDKRIRVGAPDGGDGGSGGNVEIIAHANIHDLSSLRLKTIQAERGRNGSARGNNGKTGGRCQIRVPCGTLIYEINLQNQIQNKRFLIDLNNDNQSIIVAKGGEYGKGNKLHPFMKPQDRFGKPGQEKTLFLELKMLADIGLVGFPNIGKSTFLAASTRALPKIANYEFTTLKPSIGFVKFVDDYQMTIADIPGIIQNAHLNKGLGLEFLRHIERTKSLVFMLDITQPDPLEHYRLLQKQLFEYKNNILKDKKRIVIFNKMDCLANAEEKFKIFSGRLALKSFLVSSKEGTGVGNALLQLKRINEEIQAEQLAKAEKQKNFQTSKEKTAF